MPPPYQPSAAEIQQQRANAINQEGLVAYRNGDYARAITLFEQALALSTNTNSAVTIRHNLANSYGNLGVEAHYRGDYTGAIRLYEQALAAGPDEQNAETLHDNINNANSYLVEQQAIEQEKREREAAAKRAAAEERERVRRETFAKGQLELSRARQQINPETIARAEEHLKAAHGLLEQQASTAAGRAAGGNTKFFGLPAGPGAEAAGPTAPPGSQTTYKSAAEQAEAAAYSSGEVAACVFDGQSGCPRAPTGQRLDTLKLSSNSEALKAMAAKIATKEKLVADAEFITSFNWYRHFDAQMVENKSKLAEIQKQIDSGKGVMPVLKAYKRTLENEAKHLEQLEVTAMKKMDVRAKDLQVRMEWNEEPATTDQASPPQVQQPATPAAPNELRDKPNGS